MNDRLFATNAIEVTRQHHNGLQNYIYQQVRHLARYQAVKRYLLSRHWQQQRPYQQVRLLAARSTLTRCRRLLARQRTRRA